MKQKWRLFSYWSIDCKAAQNFLNSMASQGWELEQLALGIFARFRSTSRRDLTYFLDWTDISQQEAPEYVQLCADAGWERRGTFGSVVIYASRPGTRPAPIQTDPEIEYQRLRKKTFWGIPTFFLLVLLLLTAPLIYLDRLRGNGPPPDFLLRSNLLTGVLFTLPLLILGAGLYLCYFLWRLGQMRRSRRKGEPLPTPGPVSAQVWGVLRLLGLCWAASLLLCSLSDLLLNTSPLTLLLLPIPLSILWALSSCPPPGKWLTHWRRLLLLYLVCCLFHWPIRQVFPGRIPAGPVIPGAVCSSETRYDTLFGSCGFWYETPADERPASFLISVWATPEQAAAALNEAAASADKVPGRQWKAVDGFSGVYQLLFTPSEPDQFTYYILRENILFYCSPANSGISGEQLLTDALTWLEGVK